MRIFHFKRKSFSKYGMQKIHGDENNENKLHYLEDSPYVDGSFHFEYLPLLYADSRLNAQ